MLTIKDIQTPGYNKRIRRLSFCEIPDELSVSAAAVKALSLEADMQVEDLNVLLDQISSTEFESAKERALKLLSMRDHSLFEIEQKLKSEAFQSKTVQAIIEYLSGYSLVNDEHLLSRLLEREMVRGTGMNKIRMKLKIKGFSDEQIDQAVQALNFEDYDEVATLVALKLIAKIDTSERKSRDRAYRMLRNKGYSHEICIQALNKRSNN